MQQQRLLRQRFVGVAGCPHGTVLLPTMQLSLQAGDHICLLPNLDALFTVQIFPWQTPGLDTPWRRMRMCFLVSWNARASTWAVVLCRPA